MRLGITLATIYSGTPHPASRQRFSISSLMSGSVHERLRISELQFPVQTSARLIPQAQIGSGATPHVTLARRPFGARQQLSPHCLAPAAQTQAAAWQIFPAPQSVLVQHSVGRMQVPWQQRGASAAQSASTQHWLLGIQVPWQSF